MLFYIYCNFWNNKYMLYKEITHSFESKNALTARPIKFTFLKSFIWVDGEFLVLSRVVLLEHKYPPPNF